MSKDNKDPELPVNLDTESELPPDADLEERFNDFWKKNGAGIFGGIALGAVVVVGIQLFQHFDAKKEQGVRDAFASASTIESKLEFASSHPDHQLAAFAQLQVADARYSEGQFGEAADLYSAAAKVFEDPILASRSLLGQGVSLLQTGNSDAGRAVLEAIALDGTTLDQTRGEAAYHLAVSYWEAGDKDKALEMTDIVLQLEGAPFWVFRANSLRERLGADAVADAS